MGNSNINSSDMENFVWPPTTTATFNFLPSFNMSSNLTSNFNGYLDYDADDNVSSSIVDTNVIHTSDSIGARIAATLTPFPTNVVYSSGGDGGVDIQNYSVCNNTDPYCLDDGWLRHSISGTVLYCVAYFTVFVLGVVGNSFVVAVVFRTPRMRTVTNYFIVNLALADLLVIILCLPATLLSNIFIPWVLGWFMCKTVAYVQGLSVAASIYSLVAVSLDRFLAISYPLRCQLTRARAKIVIVIIWAVASVIPVPWAMYFDLEEISTDHPGLYTCQESWPSKKAENLYFGFGNLLLCYLLPLLIISYCYIMIWARVCSRSIIGETKDGQMENMMQKSKVKVIKMLVVVVFFFMLSWLPLYIIFARVKFGSELGPVEVKSISIIAPVAQWMGSANSCINPILYAFFNKKFRKGFVDIVKSRQCCGKMGRKYEDEFCSTFRRTDFQKSRQWRHETQVDFVSTSGL